MTKMNKILMVEDINEIKPGLHIIEYTKNCEIKVSSNTDLQNYNYNNCSLICTIKNNSNFTLNKVDIIKEDTTLTLNIKNNTTVNLSWVIINQSNTKCHLKINLLGNNSKCNAKVRIVNATNKCNANLICDGIIKKNTKENELVEDLKGLMVNDGTIKISPNMYVDTNEVLANHLVTIGSFNTEELFYLTSKGLTALAAKQLLLDSFISNNLNEEYQKIIKTEVINIE